MQYYDIDYYDLMLELKGGLRAPKKNTQVKITFKCLLKIPTLISK